MLVFSCPADSGIILDAWGWETLSDMLEFFDHPSRETRICAHGEDKQMDQVTKIGADWNKVETIFLVLCAQPHFVS